ATGSTDLSATERRTFLGGFGGLGWPDSDFTAVYNLVVLGWLYNPNSRGSGCFRFLIVMMGTTA
ncbi:MAG TPA: hypothetical protein VI322_01200, partial [Candidatus Saccharimonadia bacterium]